MTKAKAKPNFGEMYLYFKQSLYGYTTANLPVLFLFVLPTVLTQIYTATLAKAPITVERRDEYIMNLSFLAACLLASFILTVPASIMKVVDKFYACKLTGWRGTAYTFLRYIIIAIICAPIQAFCSYQMISFLFHQVNYMYYLL